MKKKPITPTLRAMEVGAVVKYPIERVCTIRTCVIRLHQSKRREGIRFSVRTKGNDCYVERMA